MKKVNLSQGSKIFSGILWAATYIICLLVVKEMSLGKTLGLILSFLPTITFVIFIYNYIKGIASIDELERRIQLEATAIAFTLCLLMIMTLGLLDSVVTLKKENGVTGTLYLISLPSISQAFSFQKENTSK